LQRLRGPCCLHHDEGSKVLWKVGKFLPDYTALQPRRQPSSIYIKCIITVCYDSRSTPHVFTAWCWNVMTTFIYTEAHIFPLQFTNEQTKCGREYQREQITLVFYILAFVLSDCSSHRVINSSASPWQWQWCTVFAIFHASGSV
jgi:hypothetical protein